MGRPIIFSSHIDDAYFSLGGMISKTYQEVDWTIINVFSKSNYTKISKNNLAPERVTKLRKNEELINSKKFGIKTEFWDYPDLFLRGYPRWNSTINRKKDYELLNDLWAKIEGIIDHSSKIFFPLGFGNNVDHLILFELAEKIIDQKFNFNAKIVFYEDLPYASYSIRPNAIKKYRLNPKFIDISEDMDRKLCCCSVYRSQTTRLDKLLINMYAKWIGLEKDFSSIMYERTWTLPPIRI